MVGGRPASVELSVIVTGAPAGPARPNVFTVILGKLLPLAKVGETETEEITGGVRVRVTPGFFPEGVTIEMNTFVVAFTPLVVTGAVIV